jgi:hypothetical protein
MSGTNYIGRRYMRLFVYWALAVRPRAERALLISYGVGTTAKALTDTRGLRSIDVVDISREILDLAHLPFPPPATSPLQDPRVRVHVEDGRFFLQTTRERFDLITGEPPPLKAAGVVNLYSREYFQLIRDRLAPGGIATYWLPVNQLTPRETAGVVKGFCAAFEDCTLWTGAGLEWMLAGSNRASAPSAAEFAAQWDDGVIGPQLRADGFETPEQLGACFLGDRDQLATFVRDAPPLVDDFPHRMSADVGPALAPHYATLMRVEPARRRFAASQTIARLWPVETRLRTDEWFSVQEMMNGTFMAAYGAPPPQRWPLLYEVLQRPGLLTLATWLQGFTPLRVEPGSASDRPQGVVDATFQAAQAMARRDYADADRRFASLMEQAPDDHAIARARLLAVLLSGDAERARGYAVDAIVREGPDADPLFWEWLEELLNRPEGQPRTRS